MNLQRGQSFTQPGDADDPTFAVLTCPDEHASFWCRRELQWLQVWQQPDGAFIVLHATTDWDQR